MADFKSLGAELIRAGAPIIGTAILGPMGGTIGGVLGDIVARSLGVPNTPAAIDNAIKTMPADELAAKLSAAESEAVARYSFLTEQAKAQAEVAKAQVEAVNESIRAEAGKVDGWWGHWRIVLAWTLAVETLAWPPFIMWCVVQGAAAQSLLGMSGLLITWWGARFGVVGVHVWTGSNERQAIVTGESPSIVKTIAKAVTGKK